MEANLPRDPETIYEMEDQRNWTDASYKTYVCSLLDPWPYRLEAGAKVTQRVSLVFEGSGGIRHCGRRRWRRHGPLRRRRGRAHSGDRARPYARIPGRGRRGRQPGAHAPPAIHHRLCRAPTRRIWRRRSPTMPASPKALGAEVQLELVLPEGKSPGAELAAAAEACAKAGPEAGAGDRLSRALSQVGPARRALAGSR